MSNNNNQPQRESTDGPRKEASKKKKKEKKEGEVAPQRVPVAPTATMAQVREAVANAVAANKSMGPLPQNIENTFKNIDKRIDALVDSKKLKASSFDSLPMTDLGFIVPGYGKVAATELLLDVIARRRTMPVRRGIYGKSKPNTSIAKGSYVFPTSGTGSFNTGDIVMLIVNNRQAYRGCYLVSFRPGHPEEVLVLKYFTPTAEADELGADVVALYHALTVSMSLATTTGVEVVGTVNAQLTHVEHSPTLLGAGQLSQNSPDKDQNAKVMTAKEETHAHFNCLEPLDLARTPGITGPLNTGLLTNLTLPVTKYGATYKAKENCVVFSLNAPVSSTDCTAMGYSAAFAAARNSNLNFATTKTTFYNSINTADNFRHELIGDFEIDYFFETNATLAGTSASVGIDMVVLGDGGAVSTITFTLCTKVIQVGNDFMVMKYNSTNMSEWLPYRNFKIRSFSMWFSASTATAVMILSTALLGRAPTGTFKFLDPHYDQTYTCLQATGIQSSQQLSVNLTADSEVITDIVNQNAAFVVAPDECIPYHEESVCDVLRSIHHANHFSAHPSSLSASAFGNFGKHLNSLKGIVKAGGKIGTAVLNSGIPMDPATRAALTGATTLANGLTSTNYGMTASNYGGDMPSNMQQPYVKTKLHNFGKMGNGMHYFASDFKRERVNVDNITAHSALDILSCDFSQRASILPPPIHIDKSHPSFWAVAYGIVDKPCGSSNSQYASASFNDHTSQMISKLSDEESKIDAQIADLFAKKSQITASKKSLSLLVVPSQGPNGSSSGPSTNSQTAASNNNNNNNNNNNVQFVEMPQNTILSYKSSVDNMVKNIVDVESAFKELCKIISHYVSGRLDFGLLLHDLSQLLHIDLSMFHSTNDPSTDIKIVQTLSAFVNRLFLTKPALPVFVSAVSDEIVRLLMSPSIKFSSAGYGRGPKLSPAAAYYFPAVKPYVNEKGEVKTVYAITPLVEDGIGLASIGFKFDKTYGMPPGAPVQGSSMGLAQLFAQLFAAKFPVRTFKDYAMTGEVTNLSVVYEGSRITYVSFLLNPVAEPEAKIAACQDAKFGLLGLFAKGWYQGDSFTSFDPSVLVRGDHVKVSSQYVDSESTEDEQFPQGSKSLVINMSL